ncbi:MAG: ATP-binding protein [Azoarcus sp.]|jgi:predicted ATPase|nr:ATP-binding protein [Azoarcus sp.]
MLTDVMIEGLRGVGRVELHFAPGQRVYTLFGANGVGKTKCLEAIYQFLLASNKSFAQNYWAKHRGDAPVSRDVAVMARMSDASSGMQLEVSEHKDLFTLKEIWKSNASLHNVPVVFIGAGRRASLASEDVTIADVVGTFVDRQLAYFNDLFDAFDKGQLSSLGMIGSTRTWFRTRALSANSFQESKDNREVEIYAVLSMLHEVDERIDPKFLKTDGRGRVFLKVDGEKRELGELSSGFASLVKIMQAIVAGYAAFTNEVQLQNVRGIVLIDEIDAHLHPEWQARIIPCLKTLLPNTIFYIATHSPLVLTQLKDGEAYLLKRDTDEVVRSQTIVGANRRSLVDVLERAFGVDCNELKFQAMALDPEQNQKAKQGLLSLLNEVEHQA